jgi:hypothetical protein
LPSGLIANHSPKHDLSAIFLPVARFQKRKGYAEFETQPNVTRVFPSGANRMVSHAWLVSNRDISVAGERFGKSLCA